MVALQEGGGLASLQKHLHGVVRDRAHLRSDQRCHHGHLPLWRLLSGRLHPDQGARKKPLQCAPEGKECSWKANVYIAYLKPTTLEEKGGKKIEIFERTCDCGPVVLGCIIFIIEFAVCSNWATLRPAGSSHFLVLILAFSYLIIL